MASKSIKDQVAEQRIEQRQSFWPSVDERKDIWRSDKNRPGYKTFPRTLPLILRFMDHAAGERVSGAYLDLWTQSFDEFIVKINNEEDRAFFCGYSHVRTWRDKIERLESLGFILTAPYAGRKYGFIIILNPHKVIPWIKTKYPEKSDNDIYDTINGRAVESGIVDFKPGWDHPRERNPIETSID